MEFHRFLAQGTLGGVWGTNQQNFPLYFISIIHDPRFFRLRTGVDAVLGGDVLIQ